LLERERERERERGCRECMGNRIISPFRIHATGAVGLGKGRV